MARGLPSRFSLVLAFAFPAIVAAALALAYYGYRYADDLLRSTKQQIYEDNGKEAQRLIEAMQDRIDDASNALFRGITFEAEVLAAPARATGPDELPAGIEWYVVFDSRRKVVHQVRVEKRSGAELWKGLDWASLEPERRPFRHAHLSIDGRSVLMAYAHQRNPAGDDYYVAAKMDIVLMRQKWLPDEVRALGETRRIVVLDEQLNPVYGSPIPHSEFLSEAPFGKTLYGWRIQLAPRNVAELQEQARKRQLLGRAAIPVSIGVIAIGLAVVWLAVRAERRASRLKSEFIANVSHELKTPLSLIRMFGELIATGRHKGEGDAREYAGIITRESERLSHLIDNVLDFARLERGKASYDFAEGHLPEVVERALDVCRYRLEKERMKLRTDIDPAVPAVRMDENAMTLLVLNLVDNAIKYCAEGGEVQVGLRRAPGGLSLDVADRGSGIPPDEQSRIFERFYRARTARERNVRGSGIGLALVKHIAEAHGGRVTLDSAAGRGSTFRVFVPAAPVVRETPAPEPAAVPAAGKASP